MGADEERDADYVVVLRDSLRDSGGASHVAGSAVAARPARRRGAPPAVR